MKKRKFKIDWIIAIVVVSFICAPSIFNEPLSQNETYQKILNILNQKTGTDLNSSADTLGKYKVDPDTGVSKDVKQNFKAYFEQTLHWDVCKSTEKVSANIECTSFKVPLNWGRPSNTIATDYDEKDVSKNAYNDNTQKSITISASRARSKTLSKGSLFFNPGGPGVSGNGFISDLSNAIDPIVALNYDIVTFDPRGVGSSTPVKCYQNDQQQYKDVFHPIFRLPEQKGLALKSSKAFFDSCKKLSGSLVSYVDTKSVAFDLNLFRSLLKESRIGYFGASYGTSIGQEFAKYFPERVDKMVLDGVVDDQMPSDLQAYSLANGLEDAVDEFLSYCSEVNMVSKELLCSAEASKDSFEKSLLTFIDQTRSRSSNAVFLRGSDAIVYYALINDLYSSSTFKHLVFMLAADKPLTVLVRFQTSAYDYTDYDGKKFNTNSQSANPIINCLDSNREEYKFNDSDEEQINENLKQITPLFAPILSVYNSCQYAPETKFKPSYPPNYVDSFPILIISNTNDPITSVNNAQTVHKKFANSRLITMNNFGHTSYLMPDASTKFKKAVDEYLVNGVLPTDNMTFIKDNKK